MFRAGMESATLPQDNPGSGHQASAPDTALGPQEFAVWFPAGAPLVLQRPGKKAAQQRRQAATTAAARLAELLPGQRCAPHVTSTATVYVTLGAAMTRLLLARLGGRKYKARAKNSAQNSAKGRVNGKNASPTNEARISSTAQQRRLMMRDACHFEVVHATTLHIPSGIGPASEAVKLSELGSSHTGAAVPPGAAAAAAKPHLAHGVLHTPACAFTLHSMFRHADGSLTLQFTMHAEHFPPLAAVPGFVPELHGMLRLAVFLPALGEVGVSEPFAFRDKHYRLPHLAVTKHWDRVVRGESREARDLRRGRVAACMRLLAERRQLLQDQHLLLCGPAPPPQFALPVVGAIMPSVKARPPDANVASVAAAPTETQEAAPCLPWEQKREDSSLSPPKRQRVEVVVPELCIGDIPEAPLPAQLDEEESAAAAAPWAWQGLLPSVQSAEEGAVGSGDGGFGTPGAASPGVSTVLMPPVTPPLSPSWVPGLDAVDMPPLGAGSPPLSPPPPLLDTPPCYRTAWHVEASRAFLDGRHARRMMRHTRVAQAADGESGGDDDTDEALFQAFLQRTPVRAS